MILFFPPPERAERAIWRGHARAVDARKVRAGAALGAEHTEHVGEHAWGAAQNL